MGSILSLVNWYVSQTTYWFIPDSKTNLCWIQEHHNGPHEGELDSTGVPPVPGGIDGDPVEPSITLEREAVIPPRGRQYSPHEWEKMKPTIRKHFIEDGKTYQEILNSLAPQFTPT